MTDHEKSLNRIKARRRRRRDGREVRGRETQRTKRAARGLILLSLLRRTLPLLSGIMETVETPSVAAVVKSEAAEDTIGSTADISQPQPPSREVDSLPVAGSSDDVVVSEIPCLTPSDDDFDHGEDHGDHPVETDVVVSNDELKKKIIRQAIGF